MKRTLTVIGTILTGLLLITMVTTPAMAQWTSDSYFTFYSCPGGRHLLNGFPDLRGNPQFSTNAYPPEIATIFAPWPGGPGYYSSNCVSSWGLTRHLATGGEQCTNQNYCVNGQYGLKFQVQYSPYCASHDYVWAYGLSHIDKVAPLPFPQHPLFISCTNLQCIYNSATNPAYIEPVNAGFGGPVYEWKTNIFPREIGCEEHYLANPAIGATCDQSWERSFHMSFTTLWRSDFHQGCGEIGFPITAPENPRRRPVTNPRWPHVRFLGATKNDTYNVFVATNLPSRGTFQGTVTTDANCIGDFTLYQDTETNQFTSIIVSNSQFAVAVGVLNVDIPAGQYKWVCSPFHQYGALCEFVTMNDNNSDLSVNIWRWDGTNWGNVYWDTFGGGWYGGFALTNGIQEGESFLIGGMDVDTRFSLMGEVNARGYTNRFAPVTVYKSMGSIFPIPDNTQFSYTNFGIVPEQGDYVQKYIPSTAQWWEYRRTGTGTWDLYINGSYRFTTNNFTINRGEGVRIRKPTGSTRTTWDQEWYWWPR